MKLPVGSMNALYVVCKPGYADGANKPKRAVKVQAKPIVTKIRKQEGLYV
jgi:hypothetical protein